MSIRNRFFDYGPDYSSNIKSIDEKQYDYDFNKDGDKIDIVDLTGKVNFDFAPGRPWWGEVLANILNCDAKDVPLSKVKEFVLLPHERNNVYGEVNQIEFYVNPEQAIKMINWWKDRYDHLKAYSVYPWTGEQCTTTVKSALQAGGILIPEITQKPIGMLNDMKYVVRSTSRKHFDEHATVIIIKPESSTWKPTNP